MPRHRSLSPVAGLALLALTAALTVGLTACGSGGSKAKSKPRHSTSTTTRPRHTTTSSSSSSTTAPTGPSTSDTTAPTTTSTTAPADAGCGGATGPITAAVLSGDLGPVPTGSYNVADCRLSPSHPIWAAVALRPRAGETVPQLTVVLERIGALWTVHSYAQGPTGCDAPPPVPTELRLGC
jgi:hypothetical protein